MLRRLLVLAVAIFGLTDLTTQTVDHLLVPGVPAWTQIIKLFDLDREFSLPTWYSIVLLFGIAATLGVISRLAIRFGEPQRWYWAALMAIFLGFSIDEQVLGHESVGDILGDALQSGGIFYYAWTIPAMIAVVLVGLAFVPFLRSLNSRTRMMMLLAGGLYVSGALGFEMISGLVADARGLDTLLYATLTSIEEILELSGLSVFLIVVIGELRRRNPRLTVQLGE